LQTLLGDGVVVSSVVYLPFWNLYKKDFG
jgi:hypothetical protein